MRHSPILLALLVGVVPQPAHATVLRGLSLRQLARGSTLIVRGEVLSRSARWSGGRIYTKITLRVQRSLRGKSARGQVVSFWRLGGRVGRYVQMVRGAPSFSVGDRVLVFLSPRAHRLFVTGMAQGRFLLRGGPDPRSTTVHQGLAGARLLGSHKALRGPVPLVAFERSVLALLRARPEPRP